MIECYLKDQRQLHTSAADYCHTCLCMKYCYALPALPIFSWLMTSGWIQSDTCKNHINWTSSFRLTPVLSKYVDIIVPILFILPSPLSLFPSHSHAHTHIGFPHKYCDTDKYV